MSDLARGPAKAGIDSNAKGCIAPTCVRWRGAVVMEGQS